MFLERAQTTSSPYVFQWLIAHQLEQVIYSYLYRAVVQEKPF